MMELLDESASLPSCCLSIDCVSIQSNLEMLKRKTKSRIMAVVKGNGYGLSLLEYARLLVGLGMEDLAVGSLEEALALRNGGITAPVLLLTPQVQASAVRELLERDIMITVGSLHQAEAARQAARQSGIQPKVHIKVDTGLGRYGFLPDDLQHVSGAVRDMAVLGAYTHFASPYANRKITLRQYDAFQQAIRQLKSAGIKPAALHCCASGGMLHYPEMHMDMVRLGSALLGRVPDARAHGLTPAVCLKAPVLAVKPRGNGMRIGYRGAVGTGLSRRIGILPVGLACGLTPRRRVFGLLKDRQYAVINNRRARVLGHLGIGALAVDLTGIRCVEGDVARLDVNPLYCAADIRRVYDAAPAAMERKASPAQQKNGRPQPQRTEVAAVPAAK